MGIVYYALDYFTLKGVILINECSKVINKLLYLILNLQGLCALRVCCLEVDRDR